MSILGLILGTHTIVPVEPAQKLPNTILIQAGLDSIITNIDPNGIPQPFYLNITIKNQERQIADFTSYFTKEQFEILETGVSGLLDKYKNA